MIWLLLLLRVVLMGWLADQVQPHDAVGPIAALWEGGQEGHEVGLCFKCSELGLDVAVACFAT